MSSSIPCPAGCGGLAHASRYDVTCRDRDGVESVAFGVPGTLCAVCRQFFSSPGQLLLLSLAGNLVQVIESDLAARAA